MCGASTPADALVAPSPGRRISAIVTLAPRRASSYAVAQPTMPARMTRTLTLLSVCQRLPHELSVADRADREPLRTARRARVSVRAPRFDEPRYRDEARNSDGWKHGRRQYGVERRGG